MFWYVMLTNRGGFLGQLKVWSNVVAIICNKCKYKEKCTVATTLFLQDKRYDRIHARYDRITAR